MLLVVEYIEGEGCGVGEPGIVIKDCRGVTYRTSKVLPGTGIIQDVVLDLVRYFCTDLRGIY